MTALGFIGVGNMGAALMKGFASSPVRGNTEIYAYDPLPRQQTACVFLGSEREVAEKCKYILLAVKPQSAREVLLRIAPAVTADSVIISICAGISAEFIRKYTAADAKVVRVMPNAPMMLGLGASAVAYTDNLTANERGFAENLLNSCGITEIIPSGKMNEVVCVNGSSPAFIYLFAKCFVDYAVEQGLDAKASLNLFAQSLIGAGHMLLESGMSVESLIEQVSSKGGTTIAGLERLYTKGLADVVKAACEACTQRAYELGENS